MKKLTMKPEVTMRGKKGAGHDMPGLGSAAGSKVHGAHKNVVNAASHMGKLKNC